MELHSTPEARPDLDEELVRFGLLDRLRASGPQMPVPQINRAQGGALPMMPMAQPAGSDPLQMLMGGGGGFDPMQMGGRGDRGGGFRGKPAHIYNPYAGWGCPGSGTRPWLVFT